MKTRSERRHLSEGSACDCLQEADGRWIPGLHSPLALQKLLPGGATEGASLKSRGAAGGGEKKVPPLLFNPQISSVVAKAANLSDVITSVAISDCSPVKETTP